MNISQSRRMLPYFRLSHLLRYTVVTCDLCVTLITHISNKWWYQHGVIIKFEWFSSSILNFSCSILSFLFNILCLWTSVCYYSVNGFWLLFVSLTDDTSASISGSNHIYSTAGSCRLWRAEQEDTSQYTQGNLWGKLKKVNWLN